VVGTVVLPTSGLWSFCSSRPDPVEVVVLLTIGAMEFVLFFVVSFGRNISFETSMGSDCSCFFRPLSI
jgi:hypothetical protein